MMDGNIILSVAKAMEVLQILSQAESPLSLKELATRCGYPKSTVFGLLTTMRAYDVAAQTPDGKYTLGLRLFEYGRQVERSWDISLVARPYMEHLCQRTGASVMLSVCEGGSVITLDQVETRDNLRVVSDIGSRLPIYCTSQGKVFLAHMSRTSAEALLRAQHMTQFTPHTITDLTALMQQYRGKEVIVGLRPSELTLAPEGQGEIEGTVDSVEPLGDGFIVYLKAAGQMLVAKIAGGSTVIGKTISLNIEKGKFHIFDSQTEERLNP